MHDNSSLRLASVLIAAVSALCPTPGSLWAQAPQNMDELVEHVAANAAFIRPQKVLIAPLDGCLLDQQICAVFEADVKSRLEDKLPSVGFVKAEEVIATVKKLGFSGLDVYTSGVLDRTAAETGADILVTETLKWGADGYGLEAEVFDPKKKDNSLNRLELIFQRSIPDSENDPVVIKDPESGLSLIVRKGERFRSSAFQYPRCRRCIDPEYTEAVRKKKLQGIVQLVFTVTEQGVIQDIRVANSPEATLEAAAIKAARTWKLTPAIGFDGKPFAVRMHAEISFKLL